MRIYEIFNSDNKHMKQRYERMKGFNYKPNVC